MSILSKQEIMYIVEQATKSMDIGQVYYEHSGCNITVFTSGKMKTELAKMVRGFRVADPNTRESNYCVKVDFPLGSDVYDCDFFVE